MEQREPHSPVFDGQWVTPTHEYRVTFWEQPVMEGVEPESIGWGEITIDLVGVEDVHEAIAWAVEWLAQNHGPYSRSNVPVRDRELMLYAKVPGEDRFLQIAGWDPTLAEGSDNLRRGSNT